MANAIAADHAHGPPVTDAGKLFTIAYLATGIGILHSFVTEVAGEVRRDQRARAD